jgi:serine/threonine protein kinase
VGTPLYSAPEQLEAAAAPALPQRLQRHGAGGGAVTPAKLHQYDAKADVFSLGVLLVEILHSFASESERYAVLRAARKGMFTQTECFGPEAERLARKMLSLDPELRPTANDVAEDEWICEMIKSNDKR